MRRKVVTIGSSAGITISPTELAALGIGPGSQVDVTLVGQSIEVRPVNPYSALDLEELVALVESRTTQA